MLDQGITQREVSVLFGVSEMVISNLARGVTYRTSKGVRAGDGGLRYGLEETPERRYMREAKFWSSVDRRAGAGECWPWMQGRLNSGYGNSTRGRALVGSPCAHVTAFTLANRLSAPPDLANAGMVIRHLCNYKACCNPAHLKPGTRAENQRDRKMAERLGPPPHRVLDPVPEPEVGWNIAVGDLEKLDRVARISEFWQQIDTSAGPEGCWPWVGRTRHNFGYGQMRWDGPSPVPAHRIVYLIAHGIAAAELPSATVVRHRCSGAPNCNNLRHLEIGTQADNIRDRIVDGTMIYGDAHHSVTVSDEEIRRLREDYWKLPKKERPTYTALAARYGISINSVSRILRGKSRLSAGGPTGNTDFTVNIDSSRAGRVVSPSQRQGK